MPTPIDDPITVRLDLQAERMAGLECHVAELDAEQRRLRVYVARMMGAAFMADSDARADAPRGKDDDEDDLT